MQRFADEVVARLAASGRIDAHRIRVNAVSFATSLVRPEALALGRAAPFDAGSVRAALDELPYTGGAGLSYTDSSVHLGLEEVREQLEVVARFGRGDPDRFRDDRAVDIVVVLTDGRIRQDSDTEAVESQERMRQVLAAAEFQSDRVQRWAFYPESKLGCGDGPNSGVLEELAGSSRRVGPIDSEQALSGLVSGIIQSSERWCEEVFTTRTTATTLTTLPPCSAPDPELCEVNRVAVEAACQLSPTCPDAQTAVSQLCQVTQVSGGGPLAVQRDHPCNVAGKRAH